MPIISRWHNINIHNYPTKWIIELLLSDDLAEERRTYGVLNIHCTSNPCFAHPSPPGRGFFISKSMTDTLTKRAGNVLNMSAL